MSEKFPSQKKIETPSPESPKPMKFMTPQETEQYDVSDMAADYPASEIIQDSPEQLAEKVAEFETLLGVFEQQHDLEALRAIASFSSRDQRMTSIRQSALTDLTPIVQLVEHFRKQEEIGSISRDAYEDLRAKYRVLDRAVGTVRGDMNPGGFEVVVHDR